ncbi:MAG: right-handed parallel beta-helix repeat-containing protein [Salinigranum sp.]
MSVRVRSAAVALAAAVVVAGVAAAGIVLPGVATPGIGPPVDKSASAPETVHLGAPPEPAPAAASDPVRIDSCRTIRRPGTYVLAGNLTDVRATQRTGVTSAVGPVGACIAIRSDDVVLEGAGHAVDGRGTPGTSRKRTLEAGRGAASNVSVGGTAASSVPGYRVGVAVAGPENGTIRNVTVTNLTATDWFVGVLYVRATEGTVWGTRANGNGDVGVEVLSASGTTVANTTANANGFAGVYVGGRNNNTLADDVARRNDVAGFALYGTNDNLLWRNRAGKNGVAGVALVSSDGDELSDDVLSATRGRESVPGRSGGLLLVDSTNVVASNTTASDNRRWAVYAAGDSTLSMKNLSVSGRDVTLDGRNFGLGAAESVTGREDVTPVGAGLVVTNTTVNDSAVTIGVDWTRGTRPTPTPPPPVTPGPSSPTTTGASPIQTFTPHASTATPGASDVRAETPAG